MPLTVLKFGSSVLRDERDLPLVVQEIYRHVRRGRRVIAVVSALGRTTDRLIAQARELTDRPDSAGLAALLSTGEAASVALLTLGLERSGIPATPFDAARAGLHTVGDALDADPAALDAAAIGRALVDRPVAVVPGFVGRDADGGPSLLGRGGSDLTALFLAARLGADECKLIKDVDGVYDGDPNAPAVVARRYAELAWDDAARIGGRIVQPKSLRFAREQRQCFEVTAIAASVGTVIGPGPTRYAAAPDPAEAPRPLRLGLLGLGTVGLGVFQRLAAQPERFTIARVAVRDIRKHAGEVPPDLLTDDPREVLASGCDLLVEAIGGTRPAADLIAAALRDGADVVTANKEVVALHGRRLAAIARRHGARLAYSAAVGGAAPVLETIRGTRGEGPITSVEGVLNGTTNFVLDALAEGLSLPEAVREAQRHGLAEADPTRDLDGTDAAHKLILVTKEAFGARLTLADIHRAGVDGSTAALVCAAREKGESLRLVASCRVDGGRAEGRVGLQSLPSAHPLAGVRREENRIVIGRASGAPVVVSGKGAGRWPTAEAVVADVLDLSAARSGRRTAPAAEFVSLNGGSR